MAIRTSILRRGLAVLAAWSAIAGMALPAVAEYDIPAGAGALMTAGQPTLVRAAPGWDAAVAYEIADGASVTVWDVAQIAPDGSLWYAIDGGFVPAESVTSAATLNGGTQGAEAMVTEQWVEAAPEALAPAPATAEVAGSTDPATGEWIGPAPSTGAVDPATTELIAPSASNGYVDPATGEWVEPAPLTVDAGPATGEWVDSVAIAQDVATETWVDPATGQTLAEPVAAEAWVAPVTEEWVDPATVETWVAPAVEEWIDPAAGETWVDPATAAPVDGALQPDAAYVELEQRGRDRNNNDKDKDKDKDKNKDKRDGNGGNGGGASSSGQQIADFAMQYKGYPYVYAGDGPNGFDCSGFTMFVIKKTLGVDITHDMFTQYDMGQKVGRGELQPGDLVFFENTFRRGLSHTGIYIGDGKFVHAENESTGVVTTDLNSDYYDSRWYGAVRLG